MDGRCFCGFVRYRVGGPVTQATSCHCEICRRTSGAAFVSWFTVPIGEYQLVAGTPTSFASSEHATRTFCPRCGTPLTFQSRRFPQELDITTCSLEDPGQVPPRDHTFVRSRLAWVKLADGLPEFPASRED